MANRLPSWMKTRLSFDEQYRRTLSIIKENNLNTVCQGAGCPNRAGCFASGTATFMIMGDVCTRNCHFCGVTKGNVAPLDPYEPQRVADAVKQLRLDYAVITSVTRDDLPDGGAGHFAKVILLLRQMSPDTKVEVLTPDFKEDPGALDMIAQTGPDVFNHNIETVPRLYPLARPEANYRRSLNVLAEMKRKIPNCKIKSGLMVGLGETETEVLQVLNDLRESGCDLLTIGQYLAPSEQHLPISEFIHPDQFVVYQEMAYHVGFGGVASGPLVRSSFQARQVYDHVK